MEIMMKHEIDVVTMWKLYIKILMLAAGASGLICRHIWLTEWK